MFSFNSRELKVSAVGRKIYVTSYSDSGDQAQCKYSVFYNLQRASMSSEEENTSNSDESCFPSQADDLESFNSESSGEENYLIGFQHCQFEPKHSTDEERGTGEDADEQQHKQVDWMGNLDW